MKKTGIIEEVSGPVIIGKDMASFTMREMVQVGKQRLIGEVISIENGLGTVQVYEETEGLKRDEEIIPTDKPLSVRLGPGLLGNMFDGIQRPLAKIEEEYGAFIPDGIGLENLDLEKKWELKLQVQLGDQLRPGQILGEVDESSIITHRIMVPPYVSGKVVEIVEDGFYTIEETILVLEDNQGEKHQVSMSQEWPVRRPRPVSNFLDPDTLLVTGQRVFDVFFPIVKGGAVAIPGSFGTGKTMTQHQIARYCDADIIVYIGCGERGNEMTDVLREFPSLIDPNTGKPLMDRTILIANTSNMPVAAREASIYTGITIAEYFRDQGYHVAMMADSTSRWAEALREISARLEEMPAEEGYPAYLPSRIAAFYERCGFANTLSGKEGSVTTIGAVSPAGGDFSEPVTENTKRFVSAFLALDRDLAYSRHYPAINWIDSYSDYTSSLDDYYTANLEGDLTSLRDEFLRLLHSEEALQEIVMLVGEDVLPDDERWLLEICGILKVGFLQQNAFHHLDTYVPLDKQYRMLETIHTLYHSGLEAIRDGIALREVRNPELISQVVSMKYDIENQDIHSFVILGNKIQNYYKDLIRKFGDKK